MYSVPLSSCACFSPYTIRFPFGKMSNTVNPIVPVKLLLELMAPESLEFVRRRG